MPRALFLSRNRGWSAGTPEQAFDFIPRGYVRVRRQLGRIQRSKGSILLKDRATESNHSSITEWHFWQVA
jgi:hypothetical protein